MRTAIIAMLLFFILDIESVIKEVYPDISNGLSYNATNFLGLLFLIGFIMAFIQDLKELAR